MRARPRPGRQHERISRGPYGEGVSVTKTVALFVVAALAEIGGAWLVWQGVREHRGIAFIGAGIAVLGADGFVVTLQDENDFGRTARGCRRDLPPAEGAARPRSKLVPC